MDWSAHLEVPKKADLEKMVRAAAPEGADPQIVDAVQAALIGLVGEYRARVSIAVAEKGVDGVKRRVSIAVDFV